MDTPTRVILGITGASGVLYGLRSLEKLVHLADEVQIIASANVQDIILTELDNHAPTIEAFLEQLAVPQQGRRVETSNTNTRRDR